MTKAQRLDAMIRRVLFDESETRAAAGVVPDGAVVVQGLVRTFAFHPERLAAERAALEGIIREVVDDRFLQSRPTSIHSSKGGGYSFLNLPFDRRGELWCEQPTAEVLLCLAMGLGLAGYCLPREVWKVLPGSVPYVWFLEPSSPPSLR